jgi:hypothetical protein
VVEVRREVLDVWQLVVLQALVLYSLLPPAASPLPRVELLRFLGVSYHCHHDYVQLDFAISCPTFLAGLSFAFLAAPRPALAACGCLLHQNHRLGFQSFLVSLPNLCWQASSPSLSSSVLVIKVMLVWLACYQA